MKYHNQRLEGFAEFSRVVAADGAVLLRNNNATLPIHQNEKVAVFGRIQNNYYKSGTGSGGLVNVDYTVSILDGLRLSGIACIDENLAALYQTWIGENPFEKGEGWGQEPWSQKEMPIAEAVVADFAKTNDVAIVIIGRTAGEDQDARNEPGSYLLTQIELDLIAKVTRHFHRCAVVLNVGNIIDMSWVDTYNVPAVLYAWQGGMEGGNAVADVLCGKVSPSGKLSNTISMELDDVYSTKNFGRKDYNIYQEDIYVGYRYFETFAAERVVYPFGFGLSYTSFTLEYLKAQRIDSTLHFKVRVVNTGSVAGKEVVQIYVNAPMGLLGKAKMVLIAFQKTQLLQPNASEVLTFNINLNACASYDDSGLSGFPYSFVLEQGLYSIYVGNSVRDTQLALQFEIEQTVLVEKLTSALAPVTPFKRIKPIECDGRIEIGFEDTPLRSYDLAARIQHALPHNIPYTGNVGIKLSDVASGKATMDNFIAQLSDDELIHIVRGEGMSSPKVTSGTASAFGGVTEELLAYEIPIACCADGPSGIRMDSGLIATSLPNGTCLACTWDTELVMALFEMEGKELQSYNIDFLLGPGMNIHRNPLNGRNFEYFSEDPFLNGSIAVAQIKGLHQGGAKGTLKHFTANNQETARHDIDCIVSERALREIYLKGFEMAVKQANACSIMTSYSAINGIWAASNYDLNTTILREQWGFKGLVMTDWWAKMNDEGQPASVKNVKAMVKAQNDVYMVVENAELNSSNDNLSESLQQGLLTRGELQRCAKNICEILLQTGAFERLLRGDYSMISHTTSTNANTLDAIKIHEGSILSFDGVDTSASCEKSFDIFIEEGKLFTLSFNIRSNLNPLAQIPMILRINDHNAVTLVFNGTDGQWISREKQVVLPTGATKLTFVFPQNGLAIHKVRFN